jgi:putative Holliday junction resolvase
MRVLAVDLGTVRMGVAVSDPLGMTAQPLETRPGGSPRVMARTVLDLVLAYEDDTRPAQAVGTVVVGHPVYLDGRESEMSIAAQECARLVRAYLRQQLARPVEVVLQDERWTSVAAEKALLSGGASRQTRKHKRDQVAAQLILQAYLDAHRPSAP